MTPQNPLDENAIRDMFDKLAKAIHDKDLEGIRSLYAPHDVLAFDIGPDFQVIGIENKMKKWAAAFAAFQGELDYEVRDLTVSTGGGVAFSHSCNRLVATRPDGTKGGTWVRVTACFRKIDDNWLIAHDHISAPVDTANSKALLNLEP